MLESKNFCANYLTKFLIDLNGIWSTVVTYQCDEPHTHFLFHLFNIQGREPYLSDFITKKKKKINISLYSDIY